MYKVNLILLLLVIIGVESVSANESSYKLATDDVISVTVFNESDLNLEQTKLNDDGTISVPLIGQVNVGGKTVVEVEALLTDLFAVDYLVSPRVTVSIDEYRPFYINGEVAKPGSYSFRIGMTVEMAVTIAGGFSERASKSNIYLVRENTTDRLRVRLNDEVKPGDIVTIKESFF